MRHRASSILTSILLGASVVGGLMFVFLKQANNDRAHLARLAAQEAAKAKDAQATAQKLVEATNEKLRAANAEISHAQQTVKALQEERELFLRATALEPPTARAMKGWKEAVNTALGVSCKFPPGSLIELNDAQALTLTTALAQATSGSSGETRWFSLTSYEPRTESELFAEFVTSTPVVYASRGILWVGARGARADARGDFFTLQLRKEGKTLFLLWAKIPPGGTLKTVQSVLATCAVAS